MHLVSLVNSIEYDMVISSSMTIRASDISFDSSSVASVSSWHLHLCQHHMGHRTWHHLAIIVWAISFGISIAISFALA